MILDMIQLNLLNIIVIHLQKIINNLWVYMEWVKNYLQFSMEQLHLIKLLEKKINSLHLNKVQLKKMLVLVLIFHLNIKIIIFQLQIGHYLKVNKFYHHQMHLMHLC